MPRLQRPGRAKRLTIRAKVCTVPADVIGLVQMWHVSRYRCVAGKSRRRMRRVYIHANARAHTHAHTVRGGRHHRPHTHSCECAHTCMHMCMHTHSCAYRTVLRSMRWSGCIRTTTRRAPTIRYIYTSVCACAHAHARMCLCVLLCACLRERVLCVRVRVRACECVRLAVLCVGACLHL